jgi:hypothetical protein
MQRSRRFVLLIALSILGLALSGCGVAVLDKLTTEAEAVAAARAVVVDLKEPMTVTLVQSGLMVDIYRGAYPSHPNEESRQAWQRKLNTEAWRVDFIGVMTQEHAQCPGVVIPNATVQLILSRSTGEVLTGVFGQPPCPPGTEIPIDD